jgi:hypothetical protein
MHGAKSLSARVVCIPGLEQGLLPNRHQTPYVAQLPEAALRIHHPRASSLRDVVRGASHHLLPPRERPPAVLLEHCWNAATKKGLQNLWKPFLKFWLRHATSIICSCGDLRRKAIC